MKSAKTLFILLCICIRASAVDYLAYHINVNNAERCFVNNKIDSAYYYYDRAFAADSFIFAKDAFVAAQICYKHGEIGRTKKYLLKGARWGLTRDCVASLELFNGLVRSPIFADIEAAMNCENDCFKSTLNAALSSEWNRRMAKEQRAKNGNDFAAYKELVEDNVSRIKTLMEQGRYPGDKFIGLGSNCAELANQSAFYSLAHYDCALTELKDALWDAVRKGQLHARDFAALCEFDELRHKTVDKKKYTNDRCFAEVFVPIRFNMSWFNNPDSNILKEVVINRKKYFIEDLDTEQKKKALEKSDGYRLYFSYR